MAYQDGNNKGGKENMIGRKYTYIVSSILGLAFICLVKVSYGQNYATTLKTPIPTARTSAVAAAIEGKIYLIGGLTLKGSLSVVEEYDPSRNQWSTKSNMPSARASAAAAVIDKYVFVLGGRRDGEVLITAERYDPSSNSWITCSAMPTARWHHMAAAIGGKIYVIGGIAGVGDKREGLDIVEVYDPAKNKWTRLNPMPTIRSNAAVAVLGGKIYIVSGRIGTGPSQSTTPQVDVYDPVKETWSKVDPLKQARTGSEASVLNNKIYVIGGASGGEQVGLIEVYDPATSKWTDGPILRQPRTDHNCEVVGKSIYVMAGLIGSSLSTMKILTSVEELTPN